ncbi:MAG: DUF4349 domain-containing protein [Planctomycetota bacterium]
MARDQDAPKSDGVIMSRLGDVDDLTVAVDDSLNKAQGEADDADLQGSRQGADLPAKRMVVYSASYRLRVTAADEAAARTRSLVEELGGFVQEESTDRMVVRVPVDRFEEARRRLAEVGRVLQHAIKAQDITEEYTDLELRLGVKKRFLAELQALYERGGDLADLLTVKREIDRVTEEIERIEGRMRFLAGRAAMATIQVDFDAVTERTEPGGRDFDLPFPWLRSLGIHNLMSGRAGR